MAITEHVVVIAGGGPTGMVVAAELAMAKVDVAVVERRPDHVLFGSRGPRFSLAHDRGAGSAWIAILAAWIAELLVRIYHGCDVTGCQTRGSTELETPATRPTTAMRRGTTAPEVSR